MTALLCLSVNNQSVSTTTLILSLFSIWWKGSFVYTHTHASKRTHFIRPLKMDKNIHNNTMISNKVFDIF